MGGIHRAAPAVGHQNRGCAIFHQRRTGDPDTLPRPGGAGGVGVLPAPFEERGPVGNTGCRSIA